MIARLISLVPALSPVTYLKWAIIALLVAGAYGMGNNHATQRALQRELQASSDRMRENHKQLLAWKVQQENKLKAIYEQERAADRLAYNVLQEAKANSDAGKREAERRLSAAFADVSKLRMTNDGLQNVNKMLAEAEADARMAAAGNVDPGCTMPPGVRQAIDGYIASINTNPFVGVAEAEASGVPPGTNPSHPPITCRELTASVVDILEHDAYLLGLLGSWRAWSDEALK